MLSVTRVNAFYEKFHALKDVSLEVSEGEIVAVIGSNGAGKSTLLRTVCGLLRPRSGAVYLRGKDISGYPAEKIVSMGVSMVPEGRAIFTDLSVLENLELGAYSRYRQGDRAHIASDMEAALTLFPGLRGRLGQKGGTLSGGEQQMLAIARGLMSRPRLLLLDEPSLGLAPLLVETIFDVIADLHRRRITILLVEQNSQMSLRLAHRGYVLQTGAVIVTGEARTLLEDAQIRNLYLGRKAPR
ncbi:MAG: ABC transporter ATP-binding protein [Thermodesulfobacteriota bacterium]